MVVYTNSIDYARQAIPQAAQPWSTPSSVETGVAKLTERLYGTDPFSGSKVTTDSLWKYMFVVESSPHSHYDLLIELSRERSTLPPHGVLCLAGASDKLHGFKNRSWTAYPGNIHLSVHLAPARSIEHFGVGFTILAAVSVVDALDVQPGLEGRAGIKWVNDILIDGAKVCGVLAYTQTMKDVVTSAVLGIGLNVETTPTVQPTPYVPRVAALREFSPEPGACKLGTVLGNLIQALESNYHLLLDGGYNALLDRYRRRSIITGRKVTVRSDEASGEPETYATGRVTGMGDNLELFIDGTDKPVSRGRLILHREDDV
jgi:BirA family biotin operon repressor/biotin-[acetyl-CoA-carboxylase] ligase